MLILNQTTLSQTTLDAWKSDISTARTNINTAIVNLSSSESTLTVEENQLTLKKAGTTPEQIANQEAKVEQAEANVKNFQAQLEKTILRAPINGIVTKQDAKEGEIATASSPVVSIISEAQFEIEANVPEADIAKVKVGDSAKITLDATANIDILTNRRENVIIIPQRAVISQNGDKIVKILEGENIKEKKVKTGLRGSDGNVEIIEGVGEGEKVILP